MLNVVIELTSGIEPMMLIVGSVLVILFLGALSNVRIA